MTTPIVVVAAADVLARDLRLEMLDFASEWQAYADELQAKAGGDRLGDEIAGLLSGRVIKLADAYFALTFTGNSDAAIPVVRAMYETQLIPMPFT